MATGSLTTPVYDAALDRVPADALPAPLASFWRRQAEAGAPMRDRADVLADTLGILTALNADADVLAATALDALVDVEALAKAAGIEVPERLHVLLEGQRAASRVWALHRSHGGGRNPEGMRRLLLALVRDLRVVPIVLARQLSRMRAAWRLPVDEQRALAKMTRDIHAPLANRLGIWQLKWELEDLAFRILQTEDYLRIARSLDDNRVGRERYIEQVKAQLRAVVQAQGIQADVAGRPKHIYSIWKKMQRKALPIEELYDLRALRVLVDDVPTCYAVLGLVHATWVPIPSEFDDYIARPKPNGYRSLHTAVIGPEGKTVEVQIRTREMHAQSELGVAAHWRYKEGSSAGGAAMDKRIAWMRKLLEQAAEAAGEGEASPLQGLDSDLVEDRVYALTPKGEVIDLPQGGTVLDFAYAIHSMVGHRTRGAKVDGRIVPLTQVLKTGQRVEILTGKEAAPRRDWLQPSAGFLASSRSRDKVRAWFNKLDRAQNLKEGRELLDRDLRRLGLLHADLTQVLAKFNAQTVDDLLVQVARCCQPLPGEPIAGYLTRTRGVSVHRPDCMAFLRLVAKEPARVLPVEWGSKRSGQVVAIRIDAVDRKWLLKDITTLVAQLGVHVLGLQSEQARGSQARVRILLQARIADFEQLGLLLARLESLPGVEAARRG